MHHWHKLGLSLRPFDQLMLNLHQSATELVGEHLSDIFAVTIECVFGDRVWCENGKWAALCILYISWSCNWLTHRKCEARPQLCFCGHCFFEVGLLYLVLQTFNCVSPHEKTLCFGRMLVIAPVVHKGCFGGYHLNSSCFVFSFVTLLKLHSILNYNIW